MYGVSPQPTQAPENSNNGCNTIEPLMVLVFNSLRSYSGMAKKKSQFFRSVSRSGGWGRILMALRLALDLSRIGQISTHSVQPVQSSGAT